MSRFVLCIDNQDNPASLIVGKVYRTIPDRLAKASKMIRVADEDDSEPDGYVYSASMFVPVSIPRSAEQALTGAVKLSSKTVRIQSRRSTKTRTA
jgi:hypothetical protein